MISLATATLLGAGLSLIGGLFANKTNQKIANQNIAYQKEANETNIDFQREENALTREREDNAYQRAALDLQRAGLSKTLAAGHPASAASLPAPNMQALNNQFRYESALQKLDLAERLQNMIVSRETINQNWKRIENETNETNAKIDNLKAQSSMYGSQVELNEKLSVLYGIEGKYKAKQIEADISSALQAVAESKSRVGLNNQNIEKICYEITELISRTNKLGLESQMLVYDIVGKRLQNLMNMYDFSKYMSVGMPIGYNPDGLVGFTNNLMFSDYKNPDWYLEQAADIFNYDGVVPKTSWSKTLEWARHYF